MLFIFSLNHINKYDILNLLTSFLSGFTFTWGREHCSKTRVTILVALVVHFSMNCVLKNVHFLIRNSSCNSLYSSNFQEFWKTSGIFFFHHHDKHSLILLGRCENFVAYPLHHTMLCCKTSSVVFFVKGDKPIPQARLDRIVELIEPWFFFSLVWSVGCTGDNDSWLKFSDWVRQQMKKEGVSKITNQTMIFLVFMMKLCFFYISR